MLVLLQPTNVRGTKMAYTKFRKALCDDGFVMVAPELYMRVVANRKAIDKHRRRMGEALPKTGRVTILSLTEKQWDRIEYLVGEKSYQEAVVGSSCHIML